MEREVAEETQDLHEESQWYVIHTYSGYENKVKTNLEKRVETMGMKDQIFEVVIPVEERIEIKNGKKNIVEKKIFPGYVLVNMIITDDSWYVVRNTPGVTGFVSSGTRPTPLQPDEVDSILHHETVEKPKPQIDFEVGENVQVKSGPFDGFVGTIDEINVEKGKVRVMVSMFGRETPVELDFTQVEKL